MKCVYATTLKAKAALSLFLGFCFLFSNPLFGQTTGDYRSKSTLAVWDVTALARATTLSGGALTATALDNSGYYFGTVAPTATVTGGGGSGATLSVTFDAATSRVTGLTITSGGSGYTSTPIITFSAPNYAVGWETFNGSTWVDATVPPNATNNVTIVSGHTLTITTGSTGSTPSKTLDVQGSLTLGSFTMTISGAVTVSGTLTTAGSYTIYGNVTVSGSLILKSGGITCYGFSNTGTVKSSNVDGVNATTSLTVANSQLTGNTTIMQNDGIIGGAAGSSEDGIELQVHSYCANFTLQGSGTCRISAFKAHGYTTLNVTQAQAVTINQNMELHRNSAGYTTFSMQNGNFSAAKSCTIKSGRTVTLTGSNACFHSPNGYTNATSTPPSSFQANVTYTIENGATLDVSAARFYLYTTTAQNAYQSGSGGTNSQTITVNIDGTLKLGSAVELVCAYATNHIYLNVGATGKVLGTSAAADDATNRSCKQAATPVTINAPTLALGTYTISTAAGSGYLTGFTGAATYTAPLGFVGGTCTRNPQGVATWTVASGGFTSYSIVDAGSCTVAPTSAVATGMSNVPGAWFTMASAATISGQLNGATAKTFWVGTSNSVYNPVTITNGGSGATAMAQIKIATGNTPALANNSLAVGVTWDIQPDPNTSGATITNTFDLTLGYNDNQANGSCSPTTNMLLSHYSGSAWTQLGSMATPTTGSGTDRKVSFSDFTLTSFSPFAIGNAGILPVEFQNITAKASNTGNLIEWTTASEKDNAYFTIERSNEGVYFSNIGTVKSNGTIYSGQAYQFVDKSPLSKNYYRVRQTDNNGSSTVSKIVSVFQTKSTTARFYPSVTKGDLTIETSNDVVANVHITNIMGQTIWSKSGLTGINLLNISHLNAGTYFVTIAQDGMTTTGKLLKQD